MYESYNTSIHINIVTAQVLVERRKKNGVISRKNISPQSLSEGFLTSRMDNVRHDTGLLPEGCVTVVMEKKYTYHFIRYPELYADFRYFDTGYRHFPIPRLVFGFKYMPDTHKVAGCSACVVKDERLEREYRPLPLSLFQREPGWSYLPGQQRPASLQRHIQASHAGKLLPSRKG